jgi:putative transport protein
VGLAIGALNPNLRLPDTIYLLGLVIFVYTIGLTSGPSFFASLRRKGLRDNLLVIFVLVLALGLVIIAHNALNLTPGLAAGLFTGSLTNTPALAALLDYIQENVSQASLDLLLAEPVVGYSIAYPMGVLGMMLAIALVQRLWQVDYAGEAQSLRQPGATGDRLQSRNVRVTRVEATGETVQELIHRHEWDVLFGRLKRHDRLSLAMAQGHLQIGDLVTVIGATEDLDRVTAYLGETTAEHLELDRHELDFRRMFVSNPKVIGRRLRDLNLPQQFGAIATRLRRGDIDFLPHGDTVLQPGDRVRVLAPRQNMTAVTAFFGDSYRVLSEVDILTFSLGLALGSLLGLVPIPLPGGVSLKLGLAGGPLITAMILGTLGRTGSLVWNLPYSANLTLRQMGLILFLAGVGTRAGFAFVDTLTRGNGITIFVAGATITLVVALTTLWLGHKLLKIPMSLLIGMLAGLQTQPAVLGFALEQTGNELPNVGYATVYPIATVTKIILAQLLLVLLS